MKTRPRTSTRSPDADAAEPSADGLRAAALAETVRRALAAAATAPGFADRLRRARLALDER